MFERMPSLVAVKLTGFSPLQSKDIGVQMHEELVKVTNELYTVSSTHILLFKLSFLFFLSLTTEAVTCAAAGLTLRAADTPYQRRGL